MAKLNKTFQKKVNAAEGGDFEPIPDGVYHVRLRQVDATKEGPSGPYWVWEFEVVEKAHAKRRLWINTSLSDAALWKLKEVFDAFDTDTDTDTDDLIGEVCRAVVSQRTIQQGSRAGEIANQIDKLRKADPDFEVDASLVAEKSSSPEPEDIFG